MNNRYWLSGVVLSTLLLSGCSREYNSELMGAAKSKNSAAVETLLAQGSAIDQQNNKGKTALMFAASEGNVEIARLLLERGANANLTDQYGTTSLIVAATSGYDGVVELLLAHDADAGIRDQSGGSALVNALYFGHTRSVELLLGKLAPLEKQDGEELLLLAAGLGHDAIIRLLVRAGVDVNGRGLKQRTALMAAATFEQPQVMKVLLELGADPLARDDAGITAMDIACEQGNDEILALLPAAQGR